MRLRTFLLVAACALPLAVPAQWQWIDGSGRRVFSDQPPPPGVPERNILRQPTPRTPSVNTGAEPAAQAPAATRAASAQRPAASPPGAQGAAEARKAEEERIAQVRAENCTRARAAKATLDSGMRIARMNDKGEREVMDDAARAAESARVQEIIASECAAP
ncbi:DUF4124 domain-containing protein [Ramlibacter sp. MAHUQ-53]|uniref:DUF4124 domain-containing protein n=1 Tax=unclassified Ramlibacter TaxID=2617605 RepID=UPI00362FF8FB